MPGKTAINWTELSWGLFRGCTRCAPECVNCYAEFLAGTRLKDTPAYMNLTVIKGDGRPHWTGEIRFAENVLTWCIRKTAPALVFTNSMSDPFHPGALTEWRDKFFAAMLLGNQHIYQVLTKRPDAMASYLNDPDCRARVFEAARKIWADHFAKPTPKKPAGHAFPEEKLIWPAPHIWLGTSVGSQKSADTFTEQILKIAQGWFLWWSAEPLIGEIAPRREWFDGSAESGNRIGWVVCGGESGDKGHARPMRMEWAERLRVFCKHTNTPFWYKQRGNFWEMSDYDRTRYLNDPELIRSAATTGDVVALGPDGETIRGAKVGAATLRGGTPLFWYEAKKEEDSVFRMFPAFPATFTRGDDLTALRPNNNIEGRIPLTAPPLSRLTAKQGSLSLDTIEKVAANVGDR